MNEETETKQGCLIAAFKAGEVDSIAHVVNCQRVMGSGVALAVKNSFPDAFRAYIDHFDHYDHPEELLGDVSFSGREKSYIFNLYAQFNYGREPGKCYLNYPAFKECLENMFDICREYGVRTVGMPYKIGSDRAGGDWARVKTIIEEVAADSLIKVVFYRI